MVGEVTPVTTSLGSRVFNQYRNVIHHQHCNMSIWILDEHAVELPKVSSVIFRLQVGFKLSQFCWTFLSSLIYSVGFRDACEIPCYWFNPMSNNHFVLVYSVPMLFCVFSPYDLPPLDLHTTWHTHFFCLLFKVAQQKNMDFLWVLTIKTDPNIAR